MTGGPIGGPIRALRISVLGSVSMMLACGAHLLGGGQLPAWPLLIVLAVAMGTGAVALTARRVRLPVLLPVLTVAQAASHLLLQAVEVAPACSSGAPTSVMPMATSPMVQLQQVGCPADMIGTAHSAAAASSSVIGGMPGMGWPMLMAHLAATLLTGWLLCRGERLLWRTTEQLIEAATAGPSDRRAVVSKPGSNRPTWVARSSRRGGPAAPRAPPGSSIVAVLIRDAALRS